MYKLTFEKRVWIVKQYSKGTSTNKIALAQGVTRMTVSNILRERQSLNNSRREIKVL